MLLSERISLLPHREKEKGSATVEALLVMPVVFLFIISIAWLLEVFRIHSQIGDIVNRAGNNLVAMSYAYSVISDTGSSKQERDELVGLIGSVAYSELFLKSEIAKDSVSDEIYDLKCFFSRVSLEEEIDLKVSYKVKPFIEIFGYDGLILSNRFYSKAYTGYAGKETGEEYVYISSQAEVYHTSENCPALNTTIEAIPFCDVENERGIDRQKYYPCRVCGYGEHDEFVYITPYGNRYHTRSDCPDLTRSIKKIPITEIGDRRKCYFCE